MPRVSDERLAANIAAIENEQTDCFDVLGTMLDLRDLRAEFAACVRALRADREARKPMLSAISELSRAVAPILAAFRDVPGAFSEDQLDAAIVAMGEVQRLETGFGARWFDQESALSGPLAREVADAKTGGTE